MNVNGKRLREEPLLKNKSWSYPLCASANKRRKLIPTGSREFESIREHLKKALNYKRKEDTCLRCSYQTFCDEKGKIGIIVHPKPKINIGHGAFSIVRGAYGLNLKNDKVKNYVTLTPIYDLDETVENLNENMTTAIKALKLFKGLRGIVQMIAWKKYTRKTTGEDKINIVLEKADSDLQKALIGDRFKFTSTMLKDLVYGLYYIHRAGKVHGDLKFENILVFGKRLKITDFGSIHDSGHAEIIGTFDYHSKGMNRYTELLLAHSKKELNANKEYKDLEPIVGQANDVWALGMVLYTCITKKLIPWINDIDTFCDTGNPKRSIKAAQHNQRMIDIGYQKLVNRYSGKKLTPHFQVVMEMLNPDDKTRITSYKARLQLKKIA